MAKNVFRVNEYSTKGDRVAIDAPAEFTQAELEPEEVEDVLEYTGPTADDLRREAEAFKARWEQERAEMIQKAEDEAEKIKQDAESAAFGAVRAKNEEAARIKNEAEQEARHKVNEANEQAAAIVGEAQENARRIEEEAFRNGRKAGHEEGYGAGKAEVERLISRLHTIIDKAIERRVEIIEDAEAQVIDIVLLIAKKVVKVISENQKNIVINNVAQSLRKLKQKADLVIRVNLADLDLVTEHTKEFVAMTEKVGNVTVMEDSTVDPGGAIIETDFGQIDARISAQLREIEERILELIPIRSGRRKYRTGG